MIDAASMILGSGSVLESIFEGIIGDSGLLRPVEDRQYEDGKGLVGFVDGRQVLVGNKALLESRGIRFSLDEHRKWAAGVGCACVYLAVAGELAGVFLIRLQTSVRSEEAIQIFADNGVRLAIRTTDSFLTPRLLGRLFRINAELVKILPQRLGVYVDRLQGKVRVKQAVAVNDGSLSGLCRVRSLREKALLYGRAEPGDDGAVGGAGAVHAADADGAGVVWQCDAAGDERIRAVLAGCLAGFCRK